MKKRLIALALAALMTLALCACGNDEDDRPRKESDEKSELLISGDNYEIYTVTDADGTKYEFTVSANDGSVLQTALCAEAPRAAMSADTVLGMRFTNGNKSFCRFFELEEKLCSEAYFNAFWDNGELVGIHTTVNGEQHIRLIDIFSGDIVYEKGLELDSMELLISSAELSEDGSELTIVYAGGENTDEYTLVIELFQSDATA